MQDLIKKSLKKRYRKELIFKLCGKASIAFAMIFLVVFFALIIEKGYKAFISHEISLQIDLSKESIIANSDLTANYNELTTDEIIDQIDYPQLIKQSLRQKFSEIKDEEKQNKLYYMLSAIADFSLKEKLMKNRDLIGAKANLWLGVSSKVDVYYKYKIAPSFNEEEISLLDNLLKSGEIKTVFNSQFLQSADSREPEAAGIAASLVGSLLTIAIFLIFAFPIGVMCAFYLEEFAKKNRLTDIIEISINNLAAIPSIIYGLLGLTIYLQFFHLPRSSALVGGMTLFMLVLPVIIIATRNTIRAIPQSIRDAAMSLGASKMQVTLHHLLPLSIPGIMTGTILAMSRALGETAPLLMIGMVAFIADIPQSFSEPATVLPVQIYLWSDSPEIGFAEKTAAAILVLLLFLIAFNLVAIILRKRFERKW